MSSGAAARVSAPSLLVISGKSNGVPVPAPAICSEREPVRFCAVVNAAEPKNAVFSNDGLGTRFEPEAMDSLVTDWALSAVSLAATALPSAASAASWAMTAFPSAVAALALAVLAVEATVETPVLTVDIAFPVEVPPSAP